VSRGTDCSGVYCYCYWRPLARPLSLSLSLSLSLFVSVSSSLFECEIKTRRRDGEKNPAVAKDGNQNIPTNIIIRRLIDFVKKLFYTTSINIFPA